MSLRRRLLDALLYFPDTAGAAESAPPEGAEETWVRTRDRESIHGWWFAASDGSALAHVVLCHGNAGSIRDRLPHARLLAGAGFDVLLFDYRGYGRSSGRPSEQGTYEDARAVHRALLARDGVSRERVVFLGESLGGAVALRRAIEQPPAGLILQSAFTGVRDMAAVHYRLMPRPLVPDAYPSLRLITDLRAPLLVLHGARDEIVPPSHGRALFEAASEPKRLHVFPHAGHNDVLGSDGSEWTDVIASWAHDAIG